MLLGEFVQEDPGDIQVWLEHLDPGSGPRPAVYLYAAPFLQPHQLQRNDEVVDFGRSHMGHMSASIGSGAVGPAEWHGSPGFANFGPALTSVIPPAVVVVQWAMAEAFLLESSGCQVQPAVVVGSRSRDMVRPLYVLSHLVHPVVRRSTSRPPTPGRHLVPPMPSLAKKLNVHPSIYAKQLR